MPRLGRNLVNADKPEPEPEVPEPKEELTDSTVFRSPPPVEKEVDEWMEKNIELTSKERRKQEKINRRYLKEVVLPRFIEQFDEVYGVLKSKVRLAKEELESAHMKAAAEEQAAADAKAAEERGAREDEEAVAAAAAKAAEEEAKALHRAFNEAEEIYNMYNDPTWHTDRKEKVVFLFNEIIFLQYNTSIYLSTMAHEQLAHSRRTAETAAGRMVEIVSNINEIMDKLISKLKKEAKGEVIIRRGGVMDDMGGIHYYDTLIDKFIDNLKRETLISAIVYKCVLEGASGDRYGCKSAAEARRLREYKERWAEGTPTWDWQMARELSSDSHPAVASLPKKLFGRSWAGGKLKRNKSMKRKSMKRKRNKKRTNKRKSSLNIEDQKYFNI